MNSVVSMFSATSGRDVIEFNNTMGSSEMFPSVREVRRLLQDRMEANANNEALLSVKVTSNVWRRESRWATGLSATPGTKSKIHIGLNPA